MAGRRRVVRLGSIPTSPAPTRLIVWWVRGSVRVAAVAARWRWAGRSPQARAVSRAQANRLRPRSLQASAGSSLHPRCPITPTTSTSPRCSARRAARHRRGQAAGDAPSRAMPQSRCRWIRARPGAAATAARCSRPGTATSTRLRTASAKSASTGFSQLSSGASIPASRSGQASVSAVTPSDVAPCASAVRATSSAPCPNPSALTTAINDPVARAASRRVLSPTAPRSTWRRGPLAATAGSESGRVM